MCQGSSHSKMQATSAVVDVVWKKRATVVVGSTHRRRTWESHCGRYRVVHSRCLYGPRKGPQAMPDVWYAMKPIVVSGNVCWEVISQHRKRGPAVRACEKDAQKNQDTAILCDRCGERVAVQFGVRLLFDNDARLCSRCWKHFCRYPRPLSVRAGRQNFAGPRSPSSSPDQLTFSFIDETSD